MLLAYFIKQNTNKRIVTLWVKNFNIHSYRDLKISRINYLTLLAWIDKGKRLLSASKISFF